MDFDWTERAETLRGRVRDAVVASAERLAGRDGRTAAAVRDLQGALADTGYWEAVLAADDPEARLAALAADLELARGPAAAFLAVAATRLAGALVARLAPPSLRDALLPRLRAGEAIGAVALDVDEDDPTPSFAMSGGGVAASGVWPRVANAPFADLIVAFAPDGAGVVVEAAADGVERGPAQELLGLDGLAVGRLELRRVPLPAEAVVATAGEEITAWVRRERDLLLAVGGAGLAQRAFAAARDHAQRARRGGKPLMARQEVAFRLAEMMTDAQAIELAACRAASAAVAGDSGAGTLIACARVFAAEASERVCGGAMQVSAGRGCAAGSVVERCYRDAKTAAMIGSSGETARMRIADDLLARH